MNLDADTQSFDDVMMIMDLDAVNRQVNSSLESLRICEDSRSHIYSLLDTIEERGLNIGMIALISCNAGFKKFLNIDAMNPMMPSKFKEYEQSTIEGLKKAAVQNKKDFSHVLDELSKNIGRFLTITRNILSKQERVAKSTLKKLNGLKEDDKKFSKRKAISIPFSDMLKIQKKLHDKLLPAVEKFVKENKDTNFSYLVDIKDMAKEAFRPRDKDTLAALGYDSVSKLHLVMNLVMSNAQHADEIRKSVAVVEEHVTKSVTSIKSAEEGDIPGIVKHLRHLVSVVKQTFYAQTRFNYMLIDVAHAALNLKQEKDK